MCKIDNDYFHFLIEGSCMKLIRYSMLVLLVSNPLCYGFTGAGIKHASAGVGKLGLGLICATTGVSVATMTVMDQGRRENLFCVYGKDSFERLQNSFQDGDFAYFLFKNYGSLLLDNDLSMVLSMSTMLGLCSYGTYKCLISAGNSFKEAWKGEKKLTNSLTSDSSKTEEASESLELKHPEQEDLQGSTT